MTRLLFIIGILSIAFGYGQTPRENALLVAESGNHTHLVSYNFINGKLTSKDTILSEPASKGKNTGSYVRYDLGRNFVYKNRYVISGIGNIIDVKTNSLVMEESDNLIETRGDSIIFHRRNSRTGTGYLVCDLIKRTYGFVKDKNFMSVKGIHSPNHLWGLEIDKSKLPYKIVLYNNKNKPEVIVNNLGIETTLLLPQTYAFSDVPIFWVNNHNFLYATCSSSIHRKDSITTTVAVHKYNIKTKSSEIVAKIDSVPPGVSKPTFSLDPKQKIIFHCSKGQFVIDIKEKKAIHNNMNSVDNDFAIEYNRNKDYGSIITFQNIEIGRVWCSYYNAKTTKGFIAVEYGDIGSNLGYSKGVRVWNNVSKEWTDIEIPWMSGLIGWIEK